MKQFTSSGYQDKETGITSHYGILIDDTKPIVGVMNINDSAYLCEDIMNHGIDTYFEEHLKECTNEYHDECFYHEGLSGYLVGYKLDKDTGLYDEDHTKEYCALINETTAQITYSKYVSKCALCSPCYSGQGNLSTVGKYICYNLPPELFDEEYNEHLEIIRLEV